MLAEPSRSTSDCENTKAGNPFEVGSISCRDSEAMSQGRRGDPEIMRPDHVSPDRQFGPNLRVHARDLLRDRYRLESSEQMLDEGSPPSAPGPGGAMDAVQEFAYGDDAYCTLLFGSKCVDSVRTSFQVDQQTSVYQDGQGLSGGPVEARISRRSAANSSSTGGADRMSSRNRSAGSNLALGGPSTATVTPLRVISISSPAAARLRTSEKFRAVSVAVSLPTRPAYQINQIRPRSKLEKEARALTLSRRAARPSEQFRTSSPNDPGTPESSGGGEELSENRARGRPGARARHARGTRDACLRAPAPGDSNPSWAPNGSRLAVERTTATGTPYVFSVDLRRRIGRRVAAGQDPAWSPRGTIAFHRVFRLPPLPPRPVECEPGVPEPCLVATSNDDCTRYHGTRFPITSGTRGGRTWDSGPSWSPDGSRIAFSRYGLWNGRNSTFDIFVANASGVPGVNRLTATPDVDEREAAWSPDGSQIAFTVGVATREIWLSSTSTAAASRPSAGTARGHRVANVRAAGRCASSSRSAERLTVLLLGESVGDD